MQRGSHDGDEDGHQLHYPGEPQLVAQSPQFPEHCAQKPPPGNTSDAKGPQSERLYCDHVRRVQ